MFIINNINSITTIILLAAGILFYYTNVLMEVSAQPANHEGTVMDNSTSTPDISNNFTIYQNLSMGFQIQHPIDWEPIEKSSAVDTVEFVPSASQMHHTANNVFFTVSREDISKDLQQVNLTSLTERNVKLARSLPNFTSIDSGETILGGLHAYKIKYNFTNPNLGSNMVFQTLNVWAISESNIYTISYTALNPYFLTYEKTIEKMIDTFKIIR